jgi:hypothetical protein
MPILVLKGLTVTFCAVLISSVVSMMATFVGSEGEDLRDLLILQIALVPFAIIAVLYCLGVLVRQYGFSGALQAFWQHLPGWLLFVVLAANSLVLVAEMSFLLLQYHTGNLRPWQEHVPAVSALTSSVALAFCYVGFNLPDDKRQSSDHSR